MSFLLEQFFFHIFLWKSNFMPYFNHRLQWNNKKLKKLMFWNFFKNFLEKISSIFSIKFFFKLLPIPYTVKLWVRHGEPHFLIIFVFFLQKVRFCLVEPNFIINWIWCIQVMKILNYVQLIDYKKTQK